jgi:hypothetical protein
MQKNKHLSKFSRRKNVQKPCNDLAFEHLSKKEILSLFFCKGIAFVVENLTKKNLDMS